VMPAVPPFGRDGLLWFWSASASDQYESPLIGSFPAIEPIAQRGV
jgi:hypothetical protein